jgi:CHAT domain-containing protein
VLSEGSPDEPAALLYDWLLRPHADVLATVDTVYVSPGPELGEVPFALLLDRATGRRLVESHACGIVPSLLMALGRSHRAAITPTSALVVGAGRAVDADGSWLLPLPAVVREVEAVAARYARPHALVGPEATKSAFLESYCAHDVVHFAGHAVASEQAPSLSRLLFSGASPGESALFGRELEIPGTCHTTLVALASCDSAGGVRSRSEGLVGIAHAFLARGAETVVATLWPVDDSGVGEVFVRLHEGVAAGESPVHALRHAQLAVEHGANPARLRDWAGVEAIIAGPF